MNELDEYDSFAKRMEQRFPKMYGGKYGGFATGKGWWPMIEKLSEVIQNHIDHQHKQGIDCPQVTVDQIKEKFGTLRFYYTGGDDFVNGAAWLAESMTGMLCEECGGLGKTRSGGWVRTLCDQHEVERQARIEEQARKDGLEL